MSGLRPSDPKPTPSASLHAEHRTRARAWLQNHVGHSWMWKDVDALAAMLDEAFDLGVETGRAGQVSPCPLCEERSTCVVCECSLVIDDGDGPPHCTDCAPTEDHFHDWEERRAARRQAREHRTEHSKPAPNVLCEMWPAVSAHLDDIEYLVTAREPHMRKHVLQELVKLRKLLDLDHEAKRVMAPKDDATFRAADHAMHELWTWAVGLPGYDKKKWQALERAIGELARERMADVSPVFGIDRAKVQAAWDAKVAQIRIEALEEAARECDRVANGHWETVRRRTPENGRANAEMRSGALQCSTAILRLRTPQGKDTP